MKAADLVALIGHIYRDKLALFRRHERVAHVVSGYEFNNTYQYVLQREDVHLSWLRAALSDAGVEPEQGGAAPEVSAPGKSAVAAQALFAEDARLAADFVERWKTQVATVTHARHRKMLELMLGEVVEHRRFFELAASGRADLLGRRPEGAGTGGGVMAARWIE